MAFLKINKNLAQVLVKYSDAEIRNFFIKNSLLKNQVSQIYVNTSSHQLIINEIIDRHIEFRDALRDPLNPRNIIKIEEHQKYFWDPSVISNGQVRGPQTHLSHCMFRDFASAGNSVAATNLSGIYLSSKMKTKNNNCIYYPNEATVVSGDSFGHALELSGAKIISSVHQNIVYYTNDDMKNLPNRQIIYNNMPPTNTIPDYGITYKDSKYKNIVSITDGKEQTISVATSQRYYNQPRSVFSGTTDFNEEQKNISFLAYQASIGKIPVSHIDSTRNNSHDINIILLKIQKDGLIEETRELIGFPNLFSNRHND